MEKLSQKMTLQIFVQKEKRADWLGKGLIRFKVIKYFAKNP